MAEMPAFSQAASSYAHWCGGCYLITTVSHAEARIELTISSAEQLENMRERLGPELSFAMHGERWGRVRLANPRNRGRCNPNPMRLEPYPYPYPPPGERLRLAAEGAFAGLEPMALRSRLEE